MNEKEITVRVFYDEDDLERTYIIPAFYEGFFLVVEETPFKYCIKYLRKDDIAFIRLREPCEYKYKDSPDCLHPDG